MERELGVEGAVRSRSRKLLSSKTRTHAEPFRAASAQAAGRWIGVVMSGRWIGVVISVLLLAACGSRAPTHTAITRKCVDVGGNGVATLSIAAPDAGMLLVTVEERGLSVSARIDQAPREASSPVERLGAIALVADTAASQIHTLRVHSQDSSEMKGEACASIELIRDTDRARKQAEVAFARAGEAVQATNWESAFAQYLQAARKFDSLDLPRRAALVRHAMAELAYRRFDRKRDSFALAAEALQNYGSNADPVYAGVLVLLQAKALIDLPGGDLKLMEPAIRSRLAAARRYERASALGQRELLRLDVQSGFLEYSLDAMESATTIFTDAARDCREARDWECYGVASQNLALFAEERNNYALALSIYADALRALNPEISPRLVADIQDNLGHLQGEVGLFSASERTYAAAMRKYARLGDCPGFRRTLSRAGTLLVQMGTLADAENDLAQAASLDCPALLTRVDSVPDTGREVHQSLCRHHIDAATFAVDNELVVFNALLSLGDALVLEGESAGAERCIDAAQSYAVTARAQMRLANARGSVFLDHNDAKAARLSFERSLQIADDSKIPAGNEHRGSARIGVVKAQLLAKDGTSAVQSAYEALHSSTARGDIEQTITSLRLIGAAYRETGHAADAAHALQVALSLSETVPIDELDGERRATFLATQHTVFVELTELFASQAATHPEMSWQAFATSERGRARSLRYAESQETRDASSAFAAPSSTRYQELLHELVQLADQKSNDRPATLIDAIGNAAERQTTTTDAVDSTLLEKTLTRLDATLVEYSVGSRDMFAFVLDAGTLSVVHLGDRVEISNAVSDLRERLRDSESAASDVRAAAQRLARLVIWPLGGRVSGRRIIFVPDDALHTIPFSVLPWSSEAGAPLVVERAETVIAPSALFLTRAPPAARIAHNSPRIDLIGDPVFRISDWHRACVEANTGSPSKASPPTERALSDWSESLPPLPGTRAEVSMIATLARQSLPGSRIETMLGCAAVPSALRGAANGGTDFLHIATHARVDAQRPRLSALALTPDRSATPVTSAFGLLDILGLKLKSRLVVLSACDTSRGKLLPGEGVLGPAQAFLQAGSASVLASYWRIDDATTAIFMQRFYTYLFAEHLSAAAALRRAQLDTARTSSSHLWAAFALYGWPDSSI